MDKLEGVKKDYDALRKRYNEKIASHNTDLSRLEQAEEENRRLQKQIDMLMKQRDTAIHFQQQYSSSLRRYNQVLIPLRYQFQCIIHIYRYHNNTQNHHKESGSSFAATHQDREAWLTDLVSIEKETCRGVEGAQNPAQHLPYHYPPSEWLIPLLHTQDPPQVWRKGSLCRASKCPVTPSSSCNSKDQRALFELLWPSCYRYLSQRRNWISMKSPILWYQLADFLLHAYINACPFQITSKK